MVFQDPHEQRQFQTDKNSNPKDHSVKHRVKPRQPGEAEKQQRRARAAEQCDAKFDFDKDAGEIPFYEAGQPGSDTQSRQVHADDQRKLSDGIAEHIARQRSGEEFIDEAAGRDDQDVEIEQREWRSSQSEVLWRVLSSGRDVVSISFRYLDRFGALVE